MKFEEKAERLDVDVVLQEVEARLQSTEDKINYLKRKLSARQSQPQLPTFAAPRKKATEKSKSESGFIPETLASDWDLHGTNNGAGTSVRVVADLLGTATIGRDWMHLEARTVNDCVELLPFSAQDERSFGENGSTSRLNQQWKSAKSSHVPSRAFPDSITSGSQWEAEVSGVSRGIISRISKPASDTDETIKSRGSITSSLYCEAAQGPPPVSQWELELRRLRMSSPDSITHLHMLLDNGLEHSHNQSSTEQRKNATGQTNDSQDPVSILDIPPGGLQGERSRECYVSQWELERYGYF